MCRSSAALEEAGRSSRANVTMVPRLLRANGKKGWHIEPLRWEDPLPELLHEVRWLPKETDETCEGCHRRALACWASPWARGNWARARQQPPHKTRKVCKLPRLWDAHGLSHVLTEAGAVTARCNRRNQKTEWWAKATHADST